MTEFRITNLQATQVADRLNLARRVNINLSVVHIGKRTGQRVASASKCAHLLKITAVLDASVDVGIRLDRDVCFGIASQGYNVAQAVTRIILGVHVAESVV